jgi:hypothetical protein
VRLKAVIFAALAVLLACPAEAAPAAAPSPSAATVTSYAPSFFAGIRPNTALDMINALPGFALDTGDQARGFAGAAGNVLIDGDRPATKNDFLGDILQRIPASSVERIDVIRGGAPGIDMLGKTMIANVIRKPNAGLELTTEVQGLVVANGIVEHDLRVEGTRRVGQVSVEGSLQISSGPDDATGNGPHSVEAPNGAILQTDEEHYFGWAETNKITAAVEAPLAGGTLRLEGSLVANPYWSRNNDLSPLPAAQQTELFRQIQNTGETGARFVRRFGPHLGLEVYALQQLSDASERDDLATPFDVTLFSLGKRQGESILRATLSWDVGPQLTLRSGLEGDYNWLVSRTVETDQGAPVFVPAADVRVNELRGEAFTDLTWRAARDLVLEAGMRVEGSELSSRGDVVDNQTFVFPKPRMVLTWTPDAADQLELRFERDVTQLDFSDFAAQGSLEQGEHAGNPQLTPQQDWVAEATYDRRFWRGGDLSVAFRDYWYTDVIDFAAVCGDPTCAPSLEFAAPSNIGAGEKRELALALTMPTDNLLLKNGQLIVRVTWRYSRVVDPSTLAPREISGLHPLDAEAHFTQGLSSLKSIWGFDVFAASRQREYLFSEIDTQALGPWLDVFFEYKPRTDLSIRFEGDNLTTHGLEQARAFYDPFRNVGGGAPSLVDRRDPHFGQEFQVRIRKTFG